MISNFQIWIRGWVILQTLKSNTGPTNKRVSEQKMKNSLSFLQDSSYKKEIIDFSYTINEPFNNVGIRVVL